VQAPAAGEEGLQERQRFIVAAQPFMPRQVYIASLDTASAAPARAGARASSDKAAPGREEREIVEAMHLAVPLTTFEFLDVRSFQVGGATRRAPCRRAGREIDLDQIASRTRRQLACAAGIVRRLRNDFMSMPLARWQRPRQ